MSQSRARTGRRLRTSWISPPTRTRMSRLKSAVSRGSRWIRRHEYDCGVPLQIRKLSQDEAAEAFPRRGQMDLSEYVEAVSALQPGDTADLDIGDLTTRAAKRRLGQAAAQYGRRLRWARATDTDVVYFQVLLGATPRNQGFARPSGTGKTRRAASRHPRSTALSGAHASEGIPAATESEASHARRVRWGKGPT
jgi:hypothetical protein